MNSKSVSALNYALAEPANDNVPGTVKPEDTPFFVALGAVCIGIAALAAYVMMSVPENVVSMLRK